MMNKDHPTRAAYARFFEGHTYMLLVGALVLLGHLLHVEFWLNIVHIFLLSAALCVSDSVKPLAISNLIFIFQVTLQHSPSAPNYSTYYFEGAHLWIVLSLVAVLVASLIFYLVRTKFFSHIRFGKTPLLASLLALSVTFLTNGLLFEQYTISNLTFGLVQVAVYFFDFLVLWDGLRRLSAADLMRFALDLSLLVSWILVIELANVYILSFADHYLLKTELMFGWGISNSCACCLSIQVPILFYGALHNVRRTPSIVTLLSVCMAIFCTLSRNALLFTVAALLLCMGYACLFSAERKLLRIISVSAIGGFAVLCVLFVLIFPDMMHTVMDYFNGVGMGDSGRFAIWRDSLKNFKENPLFGVGFYGRRILNLNELDIVYTDFYPEFAHNTLLEMLTSAGIVGLLAYLFMRVRSLTVFFKRPSAEKVFLGLSILVFLLECQLDVFTFSIYPVFFYNFVLATAFALDHHTEQQKQDGDSAPCIE